MKNSYDRQREILTYQKELLSALINNPDLYTEYFNEIRSDYFTDEFCNRIFNAFSRLVVESKDPDVISISDLSGISLEKVIEITTYFSGTRLPLENLMLELHDNMSRNILLSLAGYISTQSSAMTEIDKIKDHIIAQLRRFDVGITSRVITMEVGVEMLYRLIGNNMRSVSFTGNPVGLNIIDKHMGGLQPGDLIILAGEISHGKTALSMSMLFNSAVQFSIPCGFISHEMTTEQIMSRFSAFATGFSAKYILTGKMSDSDLLHFNTKINTLINSNIFVQDYIRRELIDTVSAIRLMVLQHQVKWVVVENAGNITVKGKESNEERTAEISTTLKNLALELKITIILISHLSRAKDQKKEQPELNRLKHSGQLEADADVVLFIYRAELHGKETFDDGSPTDGKARAYIAKGRNYGLACSYLNFDENTTYFQDEPPEQFYPFSES